MFTMLNYVDSPPPKSASFSCHVESMLNMLNVLELTLQPPIHKAIIRVGKLNVKQTSCQLSGWMCWVILQSPLKNVFLSAVILNMLNHVECMIQHIQHDSWKQPFFSAIFWIWISWLNMLPLFWNLPFVKVHSKKGSMIVPRILNVFNIFNMTAERSMFCGRGIQHDSTYSTWQLKEHFLDRTLRNFRKLLEITTFPPHPQKKGPDSSQKNSTYSTDSTWQLKEALLGGREFNMIQHIQHDNWKEQFWVWLTRKDNGLHIFLSYMDSIWRK